MTRSARHPDSAVAAPDPVPTTDPAPGAAGAAGADELDRLAALYGSGLLDEGPQAALDALVELTAMLLDCPSAMLNVIDQSAQRVRAATGRAFPPMPRAAALCDTAIRSPGGLVIADLAADPRFPDHPLVDHGVRFYAGAPVHAPGSDGAARPIGALCVADPQPRTIDPRGGTVLRHLARLADVLIAARADAQCAVGIAVEHRRLASELARQHRLFAQAERLTGIGWWRLSLADERLEWSEGVYRIHGIAPGTPPDLAQALAFYPPAARGRVAALIAQAIETGGTLAFEEDFVPLAGAVRRVRGLGECERIDGRTTALVGVFQDVTDRHRMETALRHDANTDALTGLANRAAFDRALDVATRDDGGHGGGRNGGGAPLLVLIDLDGFKAVNDTLGHAAGDAVLRSAAARLRALALPMRIVARIGGDEFALIVEPGALPAETVAAIVTDALMLVAGDGGFRIACSGSVGVARFAAGDAGRDMLHRADAALYAAKRARIGERRRGERRHAA